MHFFAFTTTFAALALANPLPQGFAWDVVDAAAFKKGLSAAPASGNGFEDVVHRNLEKRSCAALPTGPGPVPNPDTAAAFSTYAPIISAAKSAPVPSGYINTFSNLHASNTLYGYMGYTSLSSYDVNACATKCSAKRGCIAFNTYFERDPAINPDASSCKNPRSTTYIQCVFWSNPVSASNAVNYGQWRNQFQVAIAGSNGYVNSSIAAPSGYTYTGNLGQAAINAPNDCNGHSTYIGVKIFIDGPFQAARCASACTTQAISARASLPTDGSKPQTCQFFNTYMLYKNGVQLGQYCTLYSGSWDASYGTNSGQWRGSDRYTIDASYSYSNTTTPNNASSCKKGSL